MTPSPTAPSAIGQLVWSPSDPSLGVGVILAHVGPHVRVRFARIEEERHYTTRTQDQALLRYEVRPNERVTDAAGHEARVRQRLPDVDGVARYVLADGRTVAEVELTPHVRDVGAKERLGGLQLVHPEVVRARLQGMALRRVGERPGHAAVLGTRVQWLPHQVDVASQAIARDPVRRLLADEVGLGKTVEAALIYAGLRQEGRAARVLILTPDALCIQWLGEIYRKAHELLVLLDAARLEDALRDNPGLNPFEAHQRVVASIDRLAQDPALAAQVAAAPWDLVIVDEAHHLRWRPEDGGNAGYRLVEALAHRCRHLLLLTATPMALDPTEYHALLRLLDPARFDDPARFAHVATRARDIRDLAQQLAHALAQQAAFAPADVRAATALLADDAEDAAALAALTELPPSAAGRADAAAPVLEALRQRHGLTEYVVRNRRGPVGGMPRRLPEVVALVPGPAQDALLEVGEQVMCDLAQSLADPAQARRAVGELLRALWASPRALGDILRPYSPALARELAPHIARVVDAASDADGLPVADVRLRWLVQQVRALAPGDKLLVFVETAVSVRALRDALQPYLSGQVAMFHRELAPRDQDRQVAYFRDPQGPAVMLSTEAGGEGRNFQFCHQVVLYDLPWRPATVEQRIGRVDRVGQSRDVRVMVPHFAGGYEAAVLKVMREAVGVLDGTVGGIDHGLEFVSDRVADMLLTGAGADAWKALYRDTAALVGGVRARTAADIDPILDHASFSAPRAAALLAAVPPDLGRQLEAFVQGYAGHSKLELHARGPALVAVEGAPGAAGRSDQDAGYVGTFSRTYALDHEDVEFLCFGHPLVEQALAWAEQAEDASAALAVCRGSATDGAAFLWCFGLDLPEDVPAARAYFDAPVSVFAVDEAGRRRPELETLLAAAGRPLDRMDAAPLRASGERWRRLVDQNFGHGEALAQAHVVACGVEARRRLAAAAAERGRHLARAQARERAELAADATAAATTVAALVERQAAATAALAADTARLERAIDSAQPRLLAAVAVRLVRTNGRPLRREA